MTTFRTLLARLDLARRQWAQRHLNPAARIDQRLCDNQQAATGWTDDD